jgi:DnaJ-class molecular chaperone
MSARRKSDVRQSQRADERETLLPCGACKGNGLIILDLEDGYLAKKCRWCNGSGGVDKATMNAHARWLRILAHNQKVGACKAE